MSEETPVYDLDAALAEERAADALTVRLFGQEWRFGALVDVPPDLYTAETEGVAYYETLAKILTATVDADQREAFASHTLTMREAVGLLNLLTKRQQGLPLGESEAS